MIALLLIWSLTAEPGVLDAEPVALTSTASISACDGLCAEYRSEMYEWRRIAVEAMRDRLLCESGKASIEMMLNQVATPPECPVVQPYLTGGALGVGIGALVSSIICSQVAK